MHTPFGPSSHPSPSPTVRPPSIWRRLKTALRRLLTRRRKGKNPNIYPLY
ncbi:MAG: hypothetical protein AAGC60_07380 [Acidobacteriota bacterium]